MTVDQLNAVLTRGGGVDMSAQGFSVDQLNGLATLAKGSGAQLILRNVGHLSIDALNGIATRGKGVVVFVL